MSASQAPRVATLLVALLTASPIARAQSWMAVGLPGGDVRALAADPRDPRVVYLGTADGILYRSMDGGRVWRPIHLGMINDSDVMTLTFDHRSPRTVYATACTGIYRSPDGGDHWAKVPGIPTSARRTRSFAQDPVRPDAVYAGTTEGLWASEDGMATW